MMQGNVFQVDRGLVAQAARELAQRFRRKMGVSIYNIQPNQSRNGGSPNKRLIYSDAVTQSRAIDLATFDGPRAAKGFAIHFRVFW